MNRSPPVSDGCSECAAYNLSEDRAVPRPKPQSGP